MQKHIFWDSRNLYWLESIIIPLHNLSQRLQKMGFGSEKEMRLLLKERDTEKHNNIYWIKYMPFIVLSFSSAINLWDDHLDTHYETRRMNGTQGDESDS